MDSIGRLWNRVMKKEADPYDINAADAADDIDDSKLSIAHAYLSSGESLETVCGLLNPEFRKWSTVERASYQAQLRSRLDAMRPLED